MDSVAMQQRGVSAGTWWRDAVHAIILLQQPFPLEASDSLPGGTPAGHRLSSLSEPFLVLDDLGRLTSPHRKRKGVHEGLRPALPPARAFVVHPELGKVQSPKVEGGRRLERICARRGRDQTSVNVMELGVVFVSVALKDGMEDGKGGGRARE